MHSLQVHLLKRNAGVLLSLFTLNVLMFLQEFGVDVQQSALLSVLPWFVTILVSNSSGWIADGLANSGRLSMTNTRKLLQTIGSVGPALALLYLATAHNSPKELEMGEAVGALTATLALGGFQSAGEGH
jgi:hypothetical protein